MEQLVARRAHNPKVVGSSPAPATTETDSQFCGSVFLLQQQFYIMEQNLLMGSYPPAGGRWFPPVAPATTETDSQLC